MASELEKAITDALISRNVTALRRFLQNTTNEAVKCSADFLNNLDYLINQSLSEKDCHTASDALTVIYKLGKNLKFSMGTQGIAGMIDQGLSQKMVQWFDKCKQLWILHGPQWDRSLSRLSEDFFDSLMMVHKACKDGMFGIQFFLFHIGQLVNDARICIFIRKEAISTLNIILKKVPASPEGEKILTSPEASDMMTNLAGQIMECGDYDMQVTLIELLFRLTTTDQRRKLCSHWFSQSQAADAFCQIQSLEFEVDCRTFLTFMNGLQGNSRRVKSFPCLEVYLDDFKLLMPSNDKLDKFWIDFNLGSQSISFYFSFADEKSPTGLWDSICISVNELHSYSLTEKGTIQILQLRLSEVVMTGSLKGSSITIIFCSTLDILHTVCSIYGHKKDKSTMRKTSVANMALNVNVEQDNSQVTAKMMHPKLTTLENSSSKDNPNENKRKPFLKSFMASDGKKFAAIVGQKTSDNKTLKYGMTKQILIGQGTEQSREDSFVPDTLTERIMSWRNKLSTMELPWPVPKNNPLSHHEQFANVAKKPQDPKEKISRSSHDLELHTPKKITPRRKQLDNPMNKDGHSLMGASNGKSTSTNQKKNSNAGRAISSYYSTKRQSGEKDGSRSQKRIPTVNSIKLLPMNEVDVCKPHSKITSYYSTKRQSGEKDGSRSQKMIPSVNSIKLLPMNDADVCKPHSKITSNSENHRKNVFEFTTDEQFSPEVTFNACIGKSATSCKGVGKSPGYSITTCTGELATNEKQNGKTHLFTAKDDTSFPDARQLRLSNKKAKCKNTQSQKQPITGKAFQPQKSREITPVPRGVLTPRKRNARLNKECSPNKPISKPVELSENKRPRRAATLGKNYTEPDSDEIFSTFEAPQQTKRKSTAAQPKRSRTKKTHAQNNISKHSHLDHLAPHSCIEKSQSREISTHVMEMAFSPAFNLPVSSTVKSHLIQQASISMRSSPLESTKSIATSPHSEFSVTMNQDLSCNFTTDSDVSQVSVCLSIQVEQSAITSKTEKTPYSKTESTPIPVLGETTEGNGLATCSQMRTNHCNMDGRYGGIHVGNFGLPDVGVNLSKLSLQLSDKLKNDVKTMSSFYKENMKTMQEHIFSLQTQLGKHRKLGDVQKVFLNEIHKLKQARAMLNSNEKDLKICLEKHNKLFQSYHKQAIKSMEVLKRTLRDLHFSHKHDEQLFTFQMAHLKKDMESIQERLQKTMASGNATDDLV
ncbi:uncharacterized protein sycp2 isoform X2 [Stigmatopora argus]